MSLTSEGLLTTNQINLTFAGGWRRVADYRLEDGAGVAIGSIREQIGRLHRRPMGRAEPFRPHRFEIRDPAGQVLITSFAPRTLTRMRGDIYNGRGSLVAQIRQRRIGVLFPVDVRRVGADGLPNAEIVRRQRPGSLIEMLDPTGAPIVEAQPTGSGDHGWRHMFLTYRMAFSESADVTARMIALGGFPILHMVYVAPRG